MFYAPRFIQCTFSRIGGRFAGHVVLGLMLVFILFGSNLAQAADKSGSKIGNAAPENFTGIPPELVEGIITFDLEQGNYFDALVHIDAENTDVENKIDHLAYARALAGFNMAEAAQKELAAAAKAGFDSENKKFFHIGKLAYETGDCKKALQYFKRLEPPVEEPVSSEKSFYAVNCLLKMGLLQQASGLLNKMSEGIWAAYGYYNLAMKYYAKDDSSRALVALRVAEALNVDETEQALDLNDHIRYSASELLIKQQKPELAISFLNKIRLESTVAAPALYLHGMALLANKNERAAIQSWLGVKKYPLTTPGVLETYLAIPYAYSEAGFLSRAATSYMDAAETIQRELKTLAKIRKIVSRDGAKKSLIEKSDIDQLEWFLSDAIASNTPRVAYYRYFVDQPDIYKSIELLKELDLLKSSLDRWQLQVSAFASTLKSKIRGYNRRLKKFNAARYQRKIKKVSAKLKEFRKTVELAEKENDYVALASGPVKVKYRQVENILKQSERIKATESQNALADIRRRAQLIKGLLIWYAKDQYIKKTRSTSDNLDNLDQELKRLQGALKGMQRKVHDGPVALKKLLERVKRYKSEIATRQGKVNTLIAKADKNLTRKILSGLDEVKLNLQANLERAEQGLTHVYETIALQQMENSGQGVEP